jgi:hypothetical protein
MSASSDEYLDRMADALRRAAELAKKAGEQWAGPPTDLFGGRSR